MLRERRVQLNDQVPGHRPDGGSYPGDERGIDLPLGGGIFSRIGRGFVFGGKAP